MMLLVDTWIDRCHAARSFRYDAFGPRVSKRNRAAHCNVQVAWRGGLE